MPAKGRLTAETLLSGAGLVRIARALAAARGSAIEWSLPAEVLENRLMDEVASEAVKQFTRLLGRFAGDLSLLFAATGGVFVAGGDRTTDNRGSAGRGVPLSLRGQTTVS